jgi:hypothetical protein
MRSRSDLARFIVLGVLVVLEGIAVLSAVLKIAFLPLPTVYPSLDSVAVLLLPLVIGFLTQRLEVAIVLAVAPFVILALIYAIYIAPVWQVDLVQLGVLANRATSILYLQGGLGLVGWMVRRAVGLPTSITLKPR